MKNDNTYKVKLKEDGFICPPEIIPYKSKNIRFFVYQDAGWYYAIEKETGLPISYGFEVPGAAAINAISNINSFGHNNIQAVIGKIKKGE
jgi:hypothetical protein